MPAPIGGWNAQAALAKMPITDAVILDNWIPQPGYIQMRRGFAQQAAVSDVVETLIIYRGESSGADQIFAAADEFIYDVTIQGASPVEVGSAFTSARWQYINFANDAGAFLIAVNGADTPIKYDGTTWGTTAFTGTSGSITLDPTDLVDIMAHKRRLFMIENGTMRVWYAATNAIAGACNLLDLGPIFQMGGALECCATWSLDGGQGADDFAVFMTNQGEVAVYQGTNPDEATEWALIGVFSVGLPLGRRALFKYGSDLMAVTTDGIVPLSQALKLDRAQENLVAVTSKIQNAFAVSTQAYGSNFGWQGMLYPKGSLAIINIPTAQDSAAVQYVQNVLTGSWCRFTGLNAVCWGIANDAPYFGTADGVYLWDTGAADNGNPITADSLSAFNAFGQPGLNKKFSMIRPIVRAPNAVRPALEMLTDFKLRIPTSVPTVVGAQEAYWDEAFWDSADWVDVDSIRIDWTSVTGIGYFGAPRMIVSVQSTVSSKLSTGGGDVLVTGGGDTLITESTLSANVDVQLIGYDVQFQPGGQL
jgi:hypothetical protein